jgi:rhamnosyltransferase
MNDADTSVHNALQGLACVTITYNPDLDVLKRQLDSIPFGCTKILVDNGSINQSELKLLSAECASCVLISNSENLGLAEAINRGVAHADSVAGIEYVLLLDQDSLPENGAVQILFAALRNLEISVGPCVVGPRMMDVDTGMHHGFHVMTNWRWQRVYPASAGPPTACANINGSGIMTSLDVWKRGGGMDAGLFIDHVDTDWSFLMISRGMQLFGIAQADFRHRMGVGTRKIWLFGWHLLPVRSPLRHYYLFRNTGRLLQRDYVPTAWKIWAVVKMVLTLLSVLLTGPNRLKQLSAIVKAVRDV